MKPLSDPGETFITLKVNREGRHHQLSINTEYPKCSTRLTEAAKNLFQFLKDGWGFLHPFAVFFMYNFKHSILSQNLDYLFMT